MLENFVESFADDRISRGLLQNWLDDIKFCEVIDLSAESKFIEFI